jgi:hypothetical protein
VPTSDPTASLAPTPCIEKAEAKEVDIIGMDSDFSSFPEGLLEIVDQNGDSVSVMIHNVFSASVKQIAVHYHEDIVTEICDYKAETWVEPITIDAFCYGLDAKFTEISIVVYFGSDAVSKECQSCQPPVEGSPDTVFLSYEVPCLPVCETLEPTAGPTAGPTSTPTGSPTSSPTDKPTAGPTESPTVSPTGAPTGSPTKKPTTEPTASPTDSPTPCVEDPVPDVLETFGNYPDINVADIITVGERDSDSVSFKVNQVVLDGTASVLSVYYHKDDGSVICDVKEDVAVDYAYDFKAYCTEGVTDVSVYVNLDGSTSDECNTCTAPAADSSSTAAFYFKLNCEPECGPEEIESTPAPQATLKPGGGCYTGAEDATPFGPTHNKCSVDAVPIEIVEQHDTNVVFRLKNTFGASSTVSIRYDPHGDGKHDLECESKVLDAGASPHLFFDATCVGGLAEVDVMVSSTGSISGGGSVPSVCSDENVDCLHTFVLPCSENLLCDGVPVADPTASPVAPPTGDSTPCEYEIIEDDSAEPLSGIADPFSFTPSADGSTVEFTIEQTWKTSDSISGIIPIYPKVGGGDICAESDKQTEGNTPGKKYTFTAACTDGFAEVRVVIKDGANFGSSDTVDVPECDFGGLTDKLASYKIRIPCNLCEPARRTQEIVTETVEEPSTEHEDAPYCLSEDFPCEGDEANMVYVCHYSARKGYQTFCVTEADSDILRFYSNDYCGPCEGGQGVTWGSMMG